MAGEIRIIVTAGPEATRFFSSAISNPDAFQGSVTLNNGIVRLEANMTVAVARALIDELQENIDKAERML